MTASRSLLAVFALAVGSAQAQTRTVVCPDQWSVAPQDDPCNPFRYIPSLPANAVFAALYFIVAAILTYQHYRRRCNWFLCLVIGAWCEGLGLAFRLLVRSDVHSTGKYILAYLFQVLSPCAFLAANYILLGRIVGHLDANRFVRPLKANWISWTFVLSDVFTFLLQAAGGSMVIIKDVKISDAGNKLFLAGIAIQAASFVIFTAMWAVFAFRIQRGDQTLWSRPGWKPLHWALGFTCIWFIIRSIFRTIELSQGFRGHLATNEIYVLCLDTLPLLIGIMAYCYFWPGKYLTPETKVESLDALQASHGEGQGDAAAWREERSAGVNLATLGKDSEGHNGTAAHNGGLDVPGVDEGSSVKSVAAR